MKVAAGANREDGVVVRFCGDSGDGVQLAGSRFTLDAVRAGNDVATFPDFPAEIRAPAGSLAGVSAYQIRFGPDAVFTHGEDADVLVAFNPAALKTNRAMLKDGGVLIVDRGAFTTKALAQAGYRGDPLAGDVVGNEQLVAVDITRLVLDVAESLGVRRRVGLRARNFFALGLVYWMFGRDGAQIRDWIRDRFAGDKTACALNAAAFEAGIACAETFELCRYHHDDAGASMSPAARIITGNEALSLGLLAAARLAGLRLVAGCYPITPASDILHLLARHAGEEVEVFQAEDEIAAVSAAIGASFAGAIGVTATSGPGLALKSEALGLAVALELPLVVVNVQRAGPSTGMPTRTEQADLDIALCGRSGEAPLPVIAARSPADCYVAAIEAVRVAVENMTPVILLSDAALANSAQPWCAADHSSPAPIVPPRAGPRAGPGGFSPYQRDARGVRRWAVPGVAGCQHRIGGLEKTDAGEVSYDGVNHQRMTLLRDRKVAAVATRSDNGFELYGETTGRLLVLTWGGTFGAARQAVTAVRRRGHPVSHLHLRWLQPIDEGIGRLVHGFDVVLVPELNRGQMTERIRSRFLVDAIVFSLMQGRPLSARELERKILEMVET